jgi:hypothetical protein
LEAYGFFATTFPFCPMQIGVPYIFAVFRARRAGCRHGAVDGFKESGVLICASLLADHGRVKNWARIDSRSLEMSNMPANRLDQVNFIRMSD